MSRYLIYFNQAWVGDHTPAWFAARGPLARAVVEEMKAAGCTCLPEDWRRTRMRPSPPTPPVARCSFTDGPHVRDPQFLGGFTVIDVADEQAARHWAGRQAEACGWPQEVRRFKP